MRLEEFVLGSLTEHCPVFDCVDFYSTREHVYTLDDITYAVGDLMLDIFLRGYKAFDIVCSAAVPCAITRIVAISTCLSEQELLETNQVLHAVYHEVAVVGIRTLGSPGLQTLFTLLRVIACLILPTHFRIASHYLTICLFCCRTCCLTGLLTLLLLHRRYSKR